MLSNRKLAAALSEYLGKYGMESLLVDEGCSPLSPVVPVPNYLLDKNLVKKLRSTETHNESIGSTADNYLEKVGGGIKAVPDRVNAYIIFRSGKGDNLKTFLRSYLNCPNLGITFHLTTRDCHKSSMYTKFPFSLCIRREELKIRCLLPDLAYSVPGSSAEISLSYHKANHCVLGPQYVTISDIEISTHEREGAANRQKKKDTYKHLPYLEIPGIFLYKVGPKPSLEEKNALRKGSSRVLLSPHYEMSSLATKLLCASFGNGTFYSYSTTHEHSLKSMICLITRNCLNHDNVKIKAHKLRCKIHHNSPNESKTVEVRHSSTATVSYGTEFKDIKIELEFVAEIKKQVSPGGLTSYSVSNYSFRLTSKNERFLTAVAGTDYPVRELNFTDNVKGISSTFLGKSFSISLQRTIEAVAPQKPSILGMFREFITSTWEFSCYLFSTATQAIASFSKNTASKVLKIFSSRSPAEKSSKYIQSASPTTPAVVHTTCTFVPQDVVEQLTVPDYEIGSVIRTVHSPDLHEAVVTKSIIRDNTVRNESVSSRLEGISAYAVTAGEAVEVASKNYNGSTKAETITPDNSTSQSPSRQKPIPLLPPVREVLATEYKLLGPLPALVDMWLSPTKGQYNNSRSFRR